MRALALLLAVSCASSTSDSTGSSGTQTGEPKPQDPSTCVSTPQNELEYTPDWTGVSTWLDDWCRACHNPEGAAPWDIVEVVEIQATGGTTDVVRKVLLTPGDPQESLLWRVTWDAPGTQLMPDNAPVLQDCTRRGHVEAWIAAGAPIP